MLEHAHNQYSAGEYQAALSTCESIYEQDATRTDALLLLGAVHYQLRQFNECVFYNQQVRKPLCLQVEGRTVRRYSVVLASHKDPRSTTRHAAHLLH
jgi:hypothetical protein